MSLPICTVTYSYMNRSRTKINAHTPSIPTIHTQLQRGALHYEGRSDDALDPPLSHGAGVDEIRVFFPSEAPVPAEAPETESEAEEIAEVIPATQPGAEQPDELGGYLSASHVRFRVGRAGSTTENIKQIVIETSRQKKNELLLNLLEEMNSVRTIIFVNSRQAADTLDDFLYNMKLPVTSIHSDRTQVEREAAMRAFRSGQAPILVATGVTAASTKRLTTNWWSGFGPEVGAWVEAAAAPSEADVVAIAAAASVIDGEGRQLPFQQDSLLTAREAFSPRLAKILRRTPPRPRPPYLGLLGFFLFLFLFPVLVLVLGHLRLLRQSQILVQQHQI
ncbi:hypothetical protein J3F84DRAFT_347898 [Trichoderma pleuroticola]